MKKIAFFGVLLVVLSGIVSCTAPVEETKEKDVITKKIMYDVPIVNPDIVTEEDYEFDWFWGNIPESDLDRLITKLYDKVIAGETQAYIYDAMGDYESFEAIPTDDIARHFEEEWYVFEFIQEVEENTGELIDVAIPTPLERGQIKKLRFLEEWYYEGDEFCKRVIAVAPIFVYKDSHGYEAINVLYWVDIKDVE